MSAIWSQVFSEFVNYRRHPEVAAAGVGGKAKADAPMASDYAKIFRRPDRGDDEVEGGGAVIGNRAANRSELFLAAAFK